jgi:SAM-dependent methyltransferase
MSNLVHTLGRVAIDLHEWLFDARNAISTAASVESPEINPDAPEATAHGTRYEAVRLYVLRRLVAQCRKAGPVPRTFVDIGCGKGRACFFAARTGLFSHITGVELSPQLARVAEENSRRFRAAAAIRFICQDATQYSLPSSPCLIFMNNPFDAGVLGRFLDNNRGRISAGQVMVGYFHDFHRATLLDRGFEILFRDPSLSLSLYRARAQD